MEQNTLNIIVTCPHCLELVLIAELNCHIFRHGTFIANGQQVNPHATKEVCDYFVTNDMIYGCGKPFRVIKEANETFVAIVCEYTE
jgi:hypothetical protein